METAIQNQNALKETLTDLAGQLKPYGEFSRDLWSVLTALRGPDNDDYRLKEATTAVIRYAFGLQDNTNFAVVNPDRPNFAVYRASLGYVDDWGVIQTNDSQLKHFVRHAYRAFKALGLKWDVVNEMPEKEAREDYDY